MSIVFITCLHQNNTQRHDEACKSDRNDVFGGTKVLLRGAFAVAKHH